MYPLRVGRVVLKKGRAKPLWGGHPWVYSGAIGRSEGDVAPGDIVEVADHDGRLIGRAFANPASQIFCRMLSHRADERIEGQWLTSRLQQAVAVRRRFGLPTERTNAYRLVNSEGDRLPGLIVDVYGDVAAIQFTALGMKLRSAEVVQALRTVIPQTSGVEVGAQAFSDAEGFAVTPGMLWGSSATARCREDDLSFEVDLLTAQKTGLYLDQRENRAALAEYCRDARVLDLYTYVGGFALQAKRAGASQVVAVDASGRALDRARGHASQNRLDIEFVEEDSLRYLQNAKPRAWEVVCVDPPKFARARKDLDAALKGYRRLNALAMGAVAEGGVLLTCTCSQLVSLDDFQRVVASSAADAGRRVRLFRVTSQASDHVVPLAFPEGRYLHCLWLLVE